MQSSESASTEASPPTESSPETESSSTSSRLQRSLESSGPENILESFGLEHKGFKCSDCGKTRKYYDLLHTGRHICLECSAKGDYPLSEHVAVNQRDPALLASDPELVEIKKAMVQWELDKGSSKIEVKIPAPLHKKLVAIAHLEDSSLDVLVTSALSLLVSSYERQNKG